VLSIKKEIPVLKKYQNIVSGELLAAKLSEWNERRYLCKIFFEYWPASGHLCGRN
jgi:hypothetical protein